MKEAARRIHIRMHRAASFQALPSLCCRFEGVKESNREALKIFDIARYQGKTVCQRGRSNPRVILRRFIRYMKPCTIISYSPVNNKSSFLKFLSNCRAPFTQIRSLCRIFTLHGEYSTLQLHQGHDANIERPIGVNTKPRFKYRVSLTA